MNSDNNSREIDTRISYEDMANPKREGTIAAIITTKWGTQYKVNFDDGTETISDCRQAGWKVLA